MESQTTTQFDGERQHRAQTNIALAIGIISRNPTMKFAVNGQTGEVYATNEQTGKPLEIAEAVIRIDDANGDSIFVDVEAKGAQALALFSLKRGMTVQFAGRYEVWSNKREVEGQDPIYYLNDKFKVLDRSTKADGTPNPEAVAPITVIEDVAKARHGLSLLVYGTIGKRGVNLVALSGNRTKAAFSVANNTARANRPSWFDIGAYGDVARDAASLGASFLVKVSGKIRKYTADGKRRIELNAKNIEVVARPKNAPLAPANAVADDDDMADNLLNAMDETRQDRLGGDVFGNQPIDADDTHMETPSIGDAETAQAEAAAAPRGRRSRRNAEEPLAA